MSVTKSGWSDIMQLFQKRTDHPYNPDFARFLSVLAAKFVEIMLLYCICKSQLARYQLILVTLISNKMPPFRVDNSYIFTSRGKDSNGLGNK